MRVAQMYDCNPPSSVRMPVAVLLGLVLPPLGVLAWIGLSGSQRRDYFQSNGVRAEISIVVSAAPLLLIIAAAWLGLWPDPNPNPVGPGLLFFAGAAIGTILTGLGILFLGRN